MRIKNQMFGFTSWILLRLCALITRTSCEPVAGAGLCNLVDRGEGIAEGGERGRSLMGFISWGGEQDRKGFRMAFICGVVKGKSLGVLRTPGV